MTQRVHFARKLREISLKDNVSFNRLPSHPTKERRNAKITDFNVSLRGGPNHAQSQPRAIFFALGPP